MKCLQLSLVVLALATGLKIPMANAAPPARLLCVKEVSDSYGSLLVAARQITAQYVDVQNNQDLLQVYLLTEDLLRELRAFKAEYSDIDCYADLRRFRLDYKYSHLTNSALDQKIAGLARASLALRERLVDLPLTLPIE